jgi:GT2 family glycosyltransferase
VPEPASFATLLRSVWNAAVLSLLGEHNRNFAWGGGMAIRRKVVERIGVRDAWRGALSDDYALTHAVRRAGLRVRFVPECLVPSYGSVGIGELFGWVTRQIKITRVYWPAWFWAAAVHHGIYLTFLVLGPWAGGRAALVLWVAVLGMGAWSGAARARRFPWAKKYAWAYATMFPLASFLTVQAVFLALVSRRIEWRGRTYEMRSPSETHIVS